MAKLIYTALTSVDGCIANKGWNFDWVEPHEEMHSFVNGRTRRRHLSLWSPHVRGHGRLADLADARSAVLHGGFREQYGGPQRRSAAILFRSGATAILEDRNQGTNDDLANSDLTHLPE